MRRMLVSRISRRVLAEHHIALSDTFAGRKKAKTTGDPHVGIIFTGLKIKRSVEHCVKLLDQSPFWSSGDVDPQRRPVVHINGHIDTDFAYIREHLE